MRGLAEIKPGGRHRTRRWDVLVLGSALPGMVAAIRLALRGARVLIVEEEVATENFAGLRLGEIRDQLLARMDAERTRVDRWLAQAIQLARRAVAGPSSELA